MLYNDVFTNLNARKVRYLLVGGMALTLYGAPRSTIDMDILVDLSSENLTALLEVLGDLGYKPRPPIKMMDFVREDIRATWVREKNMIAFPLIHRSSPLQQIDILADPPISYADAAKNRFLRRFQGISIPIIGIDDFIALKTASGRMQDISDVVILRKIKERM